MSQERRDPSEYFQHLFRPPNIIIHGDSAVDVNKQKNITTTYQYTIPSKQSRNLNNNPMFKTCWICNRLHYKLE